MKKKGKNAKLYLIGMIIGGMTLGLTTVIADTIINSTNVSYKTTTVKAALDDLYGLTADDVWQKIYPVGAVYISVNSTSPATLFGGTWQAFGTGRTLVGIDTSDDDFKTVEKTGGSKTKTIAVGNLPAHTHSVNALKTGNAGAHSHSVTTAEKTGVNTSNIGNHTHTSYPNLVNAVGGGTKTTVAAGKDYGFAYGTAYGTSGDGAHSHSVTIPALSGSAASAGSHSHSIGAHNTNSTGSGTALNVQNPYITVYMWKRTA